jgi:O-antigen/teichoic acid export membrane protein
MLAFGCAGAIIFAAASRPMAHSALHVAAALQGETVMSLGWIAAAIPLVTLTAGLRGILEARQRFGSLSLVRTITGALTFAGPLVAAKLSPGLPAVVFTIAAIRLVSLIAHALLCAWLTPDLLRDRRVRFELAIPLFRFGGWYTVSNLLSPLMVSMDRFLIGIFLSVTSVAYYATPYEVVTKLQVVPNAVTGVLFPAFSSSLANQRERARQLYIRGLAVIVGILAPLTVAVVMCAYPGLRLWLGEDFAAHGYRVLQLLAIGVLINGAASVPSAFLHAAGRPDVNAKLHMIEFPIYVPLACWLIRVLGIEGAALAWVARVTLDAALLFWLAQRSVPEKTSFRWEVANAGAAR